MKILAFDTSSIACSVALLIDDDVKLMEKVAPMQQAECLLPFINELLITSHFNLNQLDAIAFGCGPGSFTGIRISSSTAQGLGLATGLPIISISSLAALAQTAFLKSNWEKVIVAIDARTEQIYFASYVVNNKSGLVELEGQEEVYFLNNLVIPKGTWYGVGDGWLKYKNEIKQPLELKAVDTELYPSAHAIVKLAQWKFKRREWIKASEAYPHYLC